MHSPSACPTTANLTRRRNTIHVSTFSATVFAATSLATPSSSSSGTTTSSSPHLIVHGRSLDSCRYLACPLIGRANSMVVGERAHGQNVPPTLLPRWSKFYRKVGIRPFTLRGLNTLMLWNADLKVSGQSNVVRSGAMLGSRSRVCLAPVVRICRIHFCWQSGTRRPIVKMPLR